jgi:hypothetical protein
MADIDVAGLARSILDSVTSGAGKFLEDHKDAQAFVMDRAKRLAHLTLELATAADDVERAKVKGQMEVVELSLANELSAVAVDAAAASRVEFDAAVRSVFAFAVKALPTVLAAL